MYEKNLKNDLHKWIDNFVSVYNDKLASIPCPFAKKAWIDDKVYIKEISSLLDLLNNVDPELIHNILENNEVLIYGIDPNQVNLSTKEIRRLVDWFNLYLMQVDVVILEDDFRVPELINNVSMNQGTWILLLVQRLSKLNKASEMLKKQGYYKNWSQSNLEDIVNWRDK